MIPGPVVLPGCVLRPGISVSAFVLGLPLFELLSGFGQVGIRAKKQNVLEWLIRVLTAPALVFEVSDAFLQGLNALGRITGDEVTKKLLGTDFDFLRR